MLESYQFLKSILDTLSDHIVVINEVGDIVYVNTRWIAFGKNNACLIGEEWSAVNYLSECDKAAAMGDDFGIEAARCIRSVICGDEASVYLEYPCDSPDEKRWFMMQVTPLSKEHYKYFVISHKNITERKAAEEAVANLSRMDGLTDIANRRYFDEYLDAEWQRCRRLGLPLSLAMLDLDHFKMLNDTYGHQAGDECLKAVAGLLKKYSKRPSDLCARYGGEEFALVYGNTDLAQARILLEQLLDEIRLLKIPNEKSPTLPTLTASAGLVTLFPGNGNSIGGLIGEADTLLYAAKAGGRNVLYSTLKAGV